MREQIQSPNLAESISALMDNQSSELELQRVLKASAQDPDVQATWARYQLAGALLRNESVTRAPSDFALRISAAIEAESSFAVPQESVTTKAGANWRYQLGRLALVASVAGGMIIGVQEFNRSGQSSTYMASAVSANSTAEPAVTLPSGINSPGINTRNVAVQSGYEARPQENRQIKFQSQPLTPAVSNEELSHYVNQMIQAHSDNAAMNSGQGVLPYARVIMTEAE